MQCLVPIFGWQNLVPDFGPGSGRWFRVLFFPQWQWRPLDTSVVGDVTARRSKYMPHCRESQPVPVKDRNHNHGPSSATAIPVGLQSGKQHPSPSTHKALCEVDIYAPQDIICLLLMRGLLEGGFSHFTTLWINPIQILSHHDLAFL